MNKKFTAILIALSVAAAAVPVISPITMADTTATEGRKMENLGRGTVAVKTSDGVYLSWRLLGTESLSNQAFDIYRNGSKIKTTGVHDATCYTDAGGNGSSAYIVVPSGESIDGEMAVTPWDSSHYSSYGNSTYPTNTNSYMDIPIVRPTPDPANSAAGTSYTYSANDSSVGDLDGDGDYEIVVKWDPSNSKDNSNSGYTGNVYIDGYEISSSNTSYMWRIDLGVNIRAGAHYTQYIVYDFDSDGKSEIACKTAPGSKDGQGNYVSAAGNTATIRNADNTIDYRTSSGTILSGMEWLTVFDGETGAALKTIDYDPPRTIKAQSNSGWGDNYGNRSERYLAAVAYLDGKTPSLIMSRGYYTAVYVAAYTWDGENLSEQWLSSNEKTGTASNSGCTVTYPNGTKKQDKTKTLYGQGNHQFSVADVDNDGFDEMIFGSAIIDQDGTVLQYNNRGHGDALHVSDFDNDGNQEIFQVHEEGKDSSATVDFAIDLRRYNGDIVKQAAVGDVGRGIMTNMVDDTTAGNSAQFWSSSVKGVYQFNGNKYADYKPAEDANSGATSGFTNFAIYWDGDLGRELLDGTTIGKYTSSGWKRFIWRSGSWFPGASDNNDSKSTPCLSADIFGDWREEVIFRTGDNALRLFMSCAPTTYRLTTLMHDSQYRCAVAWQNVGYNQPPHPSYYIGSAALAKDGSTTLNYLSPATAFTNVNTVTSPSATAKPTTAPTSDVFEVPPEADTYVIHNDSTTPHGTDTELRINIATNVYTSSTPGLKEAAGLGLFRFNLSRYSGRTLKSAKLKFYDRYTNTQNKTSSLNIDYCSKDDWSETTATANDFILRGAGTPLSSLGISMTPPFSNTYAEYEADVTNAINADTDHIHTFTMWTGTGREQIVASKEYTGNDAKGPVLVVEYELEEATPTPTVEPTPTVAPTPTPTIAPTPTPTMAPTPTPTVAPTPSPTTPTAITTATPTAEPTVTPTATPTAAPTPTPTIEVTPTPTIEPTPTSTEWPDSAYPIAVVSCEADATGSNLAAVTATFKNQTAENIKFTAYYALYKNDTLVGIKSEDISLDSGNEIIKNTTVEGRYDNEAYTVKIFVWKGLVPQSEVRTVNVIYRQAQ